MLTTIPPFAHVSWFMYEMYLHPDIAHRVRKEVWSILGRAPQRDLEYDDYKHLPYLNAAFYESIRLHPNVPITRKRAAHDTVLRPSMDEATLPGEDLPALPVRKGEAVQFSDYVIARMPEVWGEDCEEFKPVSSRNAALEASCCTADSSRYLCGRSAS